MGSRAGCRSVKLGEATAIICGGKADHECNEEKGVWILKSGERIEDTQENYEKHKDEICGGFCL